MSSGGENRMSLDSGGALPQPFECWRTAWTNAKQPRERPFDCFETGPGLACLAQCLAEQGGVERRPHLRARRANFGEPFAHVRDALVEIAEFRQGPAVLEHSERTKQRQQIFVALRDR